MRLASLDAGYRPWSRLGDDHVVPGDYVALDLETSGFSPSADVPWQAGLSWWRDGVETAFLELHVDWTGTVPPRELEDKWGRIDAALTAKDEANGVKRAMVVKGMDPVQAWVIVRMATLGRTVCGHNLLRFDAPFLDAWASRVQGPPWAPFAILDTLAFARAVSGKRTEVEPLAKEPFLDWQRRLAGKRTGGFRLAADLQAAYELPAVEGQEHGALHDARLAGLLVQAWRGLLRRPSDESPTVAEALASSETLAREFDKGLAAAAAT